MQARVQTAQNESFLRSILRIPLLQKILIVNSGIVALGAVAGTLVTVWHVDAFPNDSHYELIALFGTVGLLISYVVNYQVLKATLRPLDNLQSAVDEVQAGKLSVHVQPAGLSDERFDRLVSTFNQMVTTLQEDTQQLHFLSGAILQAQEDERHRVARELHDEAAQALTSLLVRLRLLERADDPDGARMQVQELRKLTAEALEEVRRVALELRPTILDDLGLEAALGWRVDELNAGRSTQIRLSVSGVDGRLPRNLELVFYRVAQEALSNIARHAHAHVASVTLKKDGPYLTLQVVDDGDGFDMSALNTQVSGRGLGLLGMRERLALVGGELSIQSRPGGGTSVLARAPLDPAHARPGTGFVPFISPADGGGTHAKDTSAVG